MQERVLILIDGSNFYFKLREYDIRNLHYFNFAKFSTLLAESGRIVGSRYYIGKIRQSGTKKSDKLLSDQQKLFKTLHSHGFEYVLGYLLHSGGKYHEKGVDVHIAVDMIVAAYEDACDRILLVSSDTDLIPAIRKAQEKKKDIVYVGFAAKPSQALMHECKRYRLLEKSEIDKLKGE